MSAYGRPEQHYTIRDPVMDAKFKTWHVEEIDSRKRRKKGTLGIGNSSIVWSCEADKVTNSMDFPKLTLDTCSDMANNLLNRVQHRKETSLHRTFIPTNSRILPFPRRLACHRHRNLRRNRRNCRSHTSHRTTRSRCRQWRSVTPAPRNKCSRPTTQTGRFG